MRFLLLISLIITQVYVGAPMLEDCPIKNVLFSFDNSSDGRYLLTAFARGTILWNLETGIAVKNLGMQASHASFSRDGKLMILIAQQGAILFDTESKQQIRTFAPKSELLVDLKATITHDNKYVITWGHQGMTLWDLATGQKLRRYPVEENYRTNSVPYLSDTGVYAVVPSPKNDTSMLYPIQEWVLWNVYTNTKIMTFPNVNSFKFLPHDKGLSTLSYVANPTNGQIDLAQIEIFVFPSMKSLVEPISGADMWQFSASGESIVYSSWQSTRVSITIVSNLFGQIGKPQTLALSKAEWAYRYEFVEDGKYLIVFDDRFDANTDTYGVISKWDVSTGDKIKEFRLDEAFYIFRWKFVNDHVLLVSNEYALAKVDIDTDRIVHIYC